MSETNINILLENVTREQQIEVEDICFREGLTITQYFLGLHNDSQLRKEAIKDNSFIKDEKLFPPSKLAETISKSKKKRGKK